MATLLSETPSSSPSSNTNTNITTSNSHDSHPNPLLQTFVTTQRKLLKLELAEEEDEANFTNSTTTTTNTNTTATAAAAISESENKQTKTLTNLILKNVTVGMYGNVLATLCPMDSLLSLSQKRKKNSNSSGGSGESMLSEHRLTVGDEVDLFGSSKQRDKGKNSNSSDVNVNINIDVEGVYISAVVSKVTSFDITLVLSDTSSKKNTNSSKSSSKSKFKSKSKVDDANNNSSSVGISDLPTPLSLHVHASVAVHKKMNDVLDDLLKVGSNHVASGVVEMMFPSQSQSSVNANVNANANVKTPMIMIDSKTTTIDHSAIIKPFNKNLDPSQLSTLSLTLLPSPPPITLIHGPPGTGKTTVLVEIILQLVQRGQKVLVVCGSNVGVDNVVERVCGFEFIHDDDHDDHDDDDDDDENDDENEKYKYKHRYKYETKPSLPKIVRIGHPARLSPNVMIHSLEHLVQNHDGTGIVNDVKNEFQQLLKISTDATSKYIDKKNARRSMSDLRKEIRKREDKVVTSIIKSRDVILCTTIGSASRILKSETFDVVIIDEAAQSLEVSCWIPMLKGKRVILAGDHKQLPPTIKSKKAEMGGLGVTLFDRCMKLSERQGQGQAGRGFCVMLDVQYRMHELISNWCSSASYNGLLKSSDTVKHRKVSEMTNVNCISDLCNSTLVLIDTTGCDMPERANESNSKYNPHEAGIVKRHVDCLVLSGVRQEDIAVITPYNGQVSLLKSMLSSVYPRLEIKSVDGFQGCEKDVVIISLVRSNAKREIGFLKDARRLNVAVTRAKRQVCVVCDVECVSSDAFVGGMCGWFEANGDVRCGLEFMDDKNDMGEGKSGFDSKALLSSLNSALGENSSKVKAVKAVKPKPQKLTQLEKEELENERKTLQRSAPTGISLLNQVSAFLTSTESSLTFGKELDSTERFMVHGISEEVGLKSWSVGVGEERVVVVGREEKKENNDDEDDDQFDTAKLSTNPTTKTKAEKIPSPPEPIKPPSPPLSMMAKIALERKEREDTNRNNRENDIDQTVQESFEMQPAAPAAATKKNKNKTNNKSKKPDTTVQKHADLDDDAFLDAMISESENTHGRAVVGAGGYKRIINGILNAKPEAAGVVRKIGEVEALKKKIKEGEVGRKKK